MQSEFLDFSLLYLHHLLAMHPPGYHTLVDEQYLQFMNTLGAKGETYGLWEHIENLLK